MKLVRRRGLELVAAIAVALLACAVAFVSFGAAALGLGYSTTDAPGSEWIMGGLAVAYAAAPIVVLLRAPGWRGVGYAVGALAAAAVFYFGICAMVLRGA